MPPNEKKIAELNFFLKKKKCGYSGDTFPKTYPVACAATLVDFLMFRNPSRPWIVNKTKHYQVMNLIHPVKNASHSTKGDD